jgi:hypothetical protein
MAMTSVVYESGAPPLPVITAAVEEGRMAVVTVAPKCH